MANTHWTPSQRHAMDQTGRNLLLSAAAGSGKTATLTARIIQSLTDPEHPADISRLLVVTFTRAAAGELKSRISAALTEALAAAPGNRRLTEQLLRLGSAAICTIDSFCLSTVRANFQRLSLSPGFRLVDETELAVIRHNLMEELIDEYYDQKCDGSFASLVEHFTGLRDSDRLSDIFCHLYEKVSDYPEGLAFFLTCADQYEHDSALAFFDGNWGSQMRLRVTDQLQGYAKALTRCLPDLTANSSLEKSYYPVFCFETERLTEIAETCRTGSYSQVRELLLSYAPGRLGIVKGREKTDAAKLACSLRTEIHQKLTKNICPMFALSEEKIRETMQATATVCRQLFDFLSDYDQRLENEMRQRNVCDFSGIRRLTYRLLVNEDGTPTDIAQQVSQRYDAIYIDEYQDVDELQDAIFRAISRPDNRFMVGDIKQSIYGFRGAEPSLFAGYRRDYPILFPDHQSNQDSFDAPVTGETIFMSENFRCDRTVINFTNAVCSYLFSVCGQNIGYVPQDDLICAKISPENSIPVKAKVAVFLPPENSGKDHEPDSQNSGTSGEDSSISEEEDPEIAYIVSEINELLKNGRKADGTPIHPGDIAILTRSVSNGKAIAAALEAANIQTATSAEKDFFENPEVLLLLSLLSTIDNPTRDISLAAVLRSPLYGFTMDDLVLIRQRTPDTSLYEAVCAMKEALEHSDDPLCRKCQRFVENLQHYRMISQSLPVDKLLQILYRETGIMAYAGAGLADSEPDKIRNRKINLQRLYEYARRFEAGSFRGLYNFIRYIDGIIAQGTRIEFGGNTVTDAVSVMTIHKSKGLEFPVCFVSACGAYFNDTDQSQNSLLFDRRLGLALRLPDETGFARLNTPMRQQIADRQRELAREEEMRVLYVALTRARERLYVTAKSRSTQEKLEEKAAVRLMQDHSSSLLECHSYLEWILTALETGRGTGSYDLRYFSADSPVEHSGSQQNVDISNDKSQNNENIEQLEALYRKRFSFVYPYQHLTSLPSKISVSVLRPDILDTLNASAGQPEEEIWNEQETQVRILLSNQKEADEIQQQKWLTQVDKSLSRTPVFGGKVAATPTAAEKGTATHLFLQFCDFELTRKNGVKAEIHRLTENHFLPAALQDQINTRQLERFFTSRFYDSLSHATKVWREKRFYLRLPASDFTNDPLYAGELRDEHLVIQGVIDLFYIDQDGKLMLCDYKTDYLSLEQRRNIAEARQMLTERHGRQLAYYAKALEAMLGQRPDKVVIYSLPFGEGIEIDVSHALE